MVQAQQQKSEASMQILHLVLRPNGLWFSSVSQWLHQLCNQDAQGYSKDLVVCGHSNWIEAAITRGLGLLACPQFLERLVLGTGRHQQFMQQPVHSTSNNTEKDGYFFLCRYIVCREEEFNSLHVRCEVSESGQNFWICPIVDLAAIPQLVAKCGVSIHRDRNGFTWMADNQCTVTRPEHNTHVHSTMQLHWLHNYNQNTISTTIHYRSSPINPVNLPVGTAEVCWVLFIIFSIHTVLFFTLSCMQDVITTYY